jgi:riboflavin kinase / FMN adenylyltransferase
MSDRNMNVISAASELNPGQSKVCAAIGGFDGVHLGHQQVIRHVISDAAQHQGLSVVITFDRHPAATVSPQHAPPLIYPISKKLEIIHALGVDAIYLIRFDREASQTTAETFARNLARDFKNLAGICVGKNFSFGRDRGGNVTLLKTLGHELGFTVHGLANVALKDQTISSTRVREAVRSGHFDIAGQMLGRPYTLIGRVIEGDRIGRTLGFPTANLDTTGLVLPPSGVYAVHARVKNTLYRALINLGHRPTLKNPVPRFQAEAHLLDFNADIYGETLEVAFIKKLRDERRFPSLDALKEQIRRDLAAVEKTGVF